MSPEAYKAFIREAFISPIRSVLIVDDDYPTLEEILSPTAAVAHVGGAKSWTGNPKPILEVVQRFRSSTPALLVDVHDGSNVSISEPSSSARHLHQTDLLVLDYQLDRLRPGDGSKAIEVARSVVTNQNFNLVVLHTSEQLDRVFDNVLIGVLPPRRDWLTDAEHERALELIAVAEGEDEKATETFLRSVSDQHYVYMRRDERAYPPTAGIGDAPSFAAFEAACNLSGADTAQDKSILFRWSMDARETALAPKMFVGSTHPLTWSEGGLKWIRTDTAFFAFTSKGHNADLLAELLDTLAEWKPRPSRLFLAKMRAAIAVKGVGAETQALGGNHVLAHWYKDLLDGTKESRPFKIAETVGRNTEQLLDNVVPDVRDFAARLIDQELSGATSSSDLCLHYFGIDLSKNAESAKAILEHNVFVCSKPITGYHLATGHIFTLGADIWACLSPMCDLVPGQGAASAELKEKELMPFTAVKLQELPIDAGELKKGKIQSNRFVFLRIDGAVRAFSFNNKSDANSGPVWAVHYAKKLGRLPPDMKFDLLHMKFSKRGLIGKKEQATVIAQLRYEYALNLLQKLGGTMTRVGLDFASLA